MLTPAEKQTIQILGVSLDIPQESQLMAEQIAKYPGKLDFPLLTDEGHRVAETYGIVNPLETEKHGIPYPTVYLINKEGKVIYRFLDEQGHRPTNEQVREQITAAGW